MFGVPFWLIKYGAVVLVVGAIGLKVYGAGRQSVVDDLKDDRIQILKDGQEIDDQINLADDNDLCVLLGGCGVRDSAGSD